MIDRFHVSPPLSPGLVTLDGPEAHHLAHVLRKGPGAQVTLFDGSGREALAEVVLVRRKSVELAVSEIREAPPFAGPVVTIAAAAPKGDRLRFLVEKLTELGVARLVLLDTERGTVEPRERKLDKLRQTVIAACKQSGRSRLMELAGPASVADFCARELRDAALPPVAVIAHPRGAPFSQASIETPFDRPLVGLVGPEGGFTEAEVEIATAAGARPVSLGASILRIETAAIALASLAVMREQDSLS